MKKDNIDLEIARKLSLKQKYKKALPFLLKAAQAGDPEALYALGTWFYFGKGVKKNLKKAFDFSMKASMSGYKLAHFNVAICYEKGQGVKKSGKKAFQFYKKGFLAGDKKECGRELGRLFYYGIGVPRSQIKSAQYVKAAAKGGDAESCFYLSFLYDQGHGVNQSCRWADYWEQKGRLLSKKPKNW